MALSSNSGITPLMERSDWARPGLNRILKYIEKDIPTVAWHLFGLLTEPSWHSSHYWPVSRATTFMCRLLHVYGFYGAMALDSPRGFMLPTDTWSRDLATQASLIGS